MKTMQDYTTYCTTEQKNRAYELGAPLDFHDLDGGERIYHTPTTQQMINWLREEYGIQAFVSTLTGNIASVFDKNDFTMFNVNNSDELPKLFDKYHQAELAAIDAALDYLENQKN